MAGSRVDYDIKTMGKGAHTKIVETADTQIGGLSASSETHTGLFSSSQNSSVGIHGFFSQHDAQSSRLDANGYQTSNSHSETLFGATVSNSESLNVGGSGVEYQAHTNFFGQKLGFGFNLKFPKIPDLHILDTLRGIHLPHSEMHALNHAIHEVVQAGHHSGILEMGGHAIHFVIEGGKVVVDVVGAVLDAMPK